MSEINVNLLDNAHAPLAPSSGKRIINCPGSVGVKRKAPPQKSSKYAMLGTAAHDLGAKCLEQGKNAKDFEGETILVVDPGGSTDSFRVDDNMMEAVQVYLDAIADVTPEGSIVAVEQKVNVQWIHKDLWGTSDYNAFAAAQKLLVVADYKHGEGISVPVEWNPQLMIYALGAINDLYVRGIITSLTKELHFIDLVIVQPRDRSSYDKVHRWRISAKDLMFWAVHVLMPACARTDDPDAPCIPGEHCRFCVPTCPAKTARALELAKTEFNSPVFPAPQDMTPEDLVKVSEFAAAFSNWGKDVDEYIHGEMERGVMIPGLKLVAKKSNRKWINETVAAVKVKHLLGAAAYKEPKLLTMAQAEKAIKAKGLDSAVALNGLWEKPDNGTVIAPLSDKRAAVGASVIKEFVADDDFMN